MTRKLKKNRDILTYYFENLISAIFFKRNSIKFQPGWKEIISDSLNKKAFNIEHRVIDSINSKLIPEIENIDDQEGSISEDVYPMR